MSLPTYTDILIVGAGPVGLACALSLEQQGCKDSITIVEGKDHRDTSSRALAVHSATIEALGEIGCADALVSHGRKNTVVTIWDGFQYIHLADFNTIKSYTPYPFSIFIPQYTTETILEEKVKEKGIRLCLPFKVTEIKANIQDPDTTDVYFDDGSVVQARYIVAADGSHSAVRKAAGVPYKNPFSDKLYDPTETFSQMVLADVTFEQPPPERFNAMHIFLPSENGCLWIPLPEHAYDDSGLVYRIGFGIPQSMGIPPHAPPKEYIQELLDAFGPGTIKSPDSASKFTIKDVKWSTRFKQSSSIIDTFFTRLGWKPEEQKFDGGVLCFIGDAAHIHSPFGGQGMNLGIRDAVSLGKALAKHLQDPSKPVSPSEYRAKDKGLQAWADNRRKQGLTVIGLTRNLLGMANLKNQITWKWGFIPVNAMRVRNIVLSILTRFTFFKQNVAWRLSGLGNR